MKKIIVSSDEIQVDDMKINRVESEKDLGSWLESIEFVDEAGARLPMELEEDDSIDPEGDRGE